MFTLMTLPLAGAEFHQVVEARHSGYDFDPSRSITRSEIEKLVKTAESAPSSYNDQPWRYIITDKKTTPEAYQKVLSSLVEFNQNWAKEAPVLVVVVADTHFTKNDKPNTHAFYDAGASAAFFVLQASELGIMTHQMGGFDPQKVSNAFNIPPRYQPITVIAVGYEKPGTPVKDKSRRPTEDQFFFGKWGK